MWRPARSAVNCTPINKVVKMFHFIGLEPADWRARFFPIWVGQAFSLLGSNVVQFALVWWLTKTTGSATVLATATMLSLLPGVVVGPFAGALVDRWNRRWVMVLADGGIALASAWLAFMFFIGAEQPWHIYVIMLLRATGGAFHWPAMQASTSLMVPKEHLSRVAGLNQALYGGMNIAAPPVGALLLAALPMYGILGIDITTAIIGIIPLLIFAVPQPRCAVDDSDRPNMWKDLRLGLHYLGQWPGLIHVLGLAGVIELLSIPAYMLTPILVAQYFQGDAFLLGAMNSAYGIGFVAGGLILSAWGGFKRRILTTLMGFVGIGFAMTAVGLTPPWAVWVAIVAAGVTGAMHALITGPLLAIIQTLVVPEMQGRMLTLVISLVSAMAPVSMLIAGPTADLIGVRTLYLIGGIGCTLVGAYSFTLRSVTHLEEGRERYGEEQPLVAPWARSE